MKLVLHNVTQTHTQRATGGFMQISCPLQ